MKTDSVPFAAKRTITLLRISRGWLLATNQPTITELLFPGPMLQSERHSFFSAYFGRKCMQGQLLKEREQVQDKCPSMMNAFELITLSQGLNLSPLFDRRQVCYLILLFTSSSGERACSLSWKWIILVACTLVSYYKWASLDTHLFQLGPQDNGGLVKNEPRVGLWFMHFEWVLLH